MMLEWLLLLFVPALVLLYFLRLKRQELVVPSTLLWEQSIEDLRANSPFQRIRRSLLFFLQLAAIVFLVTALWRPRLESETTLGRQLVLLIDNSASMAAREEGGVRQEHAERLALGIVDSMKEGDRAAVLSFASRTEMLQPLTGDLDSLREAIENIEPTGLPTSLSQALVVTSGLVSNLADAEIHVIGDGCYGDMGSLPDRVKRLELRFHVIGSAQGNIGIVEADARRTFEREQRIEVFGLVKNSSREGRRLEVFLYHEEQLVDSSPTLVIPPGESRSVVFDATRLGSGVLRLHVDGADALPLDDDAFLRISAPQEVEVLVVGPENGFLDAALASIPFASSRRMSLAAYLEQGGPVASGDAAGERERGTVSIFDREAPARPIPGPSIYIDCVPPLPEGLASLHEEENPQVLDWDHDHPVNRFIAYDDLRIARARVLDRSPSCQPVVETESGALIGALSTVGASGERTQALWIGFDILESNWPLGHYSFPFFFTNAVSWLVSGQEGGRSRWRTGEKLVERPRTGRAPAPGDWIWRSPTGRVTPATVESRRDVILAVADEVGLYELRESGERRRRYPVSLLDAAETTLTPAKSVSFGEFEVDLEPTLVESRRDLWPWFAVAALLVMLFEWYIYHRRVYV